MFVGLGTLLNLLAIITGAALGRLAGNRLSRKTRDLITDVLGAVTLISAAGSVSALWNADLVERVPSGAPILILLGSLLLGGLFGTWLRIEERLEALGEILKRRFGGGESEFVTGFVSATLIFAIGPLAILGSISDGMGTGIDQLLLKSILDFFASIAFAAALGWGVAFSALPVALYQGLWTLAGLGLGSVMDDYQIVAMTATGGVLLLGIAFKLLQLKTIAIGNLLPALALAPLIAFCAASL